MKKRAVVLLSGGLDSAVALFYAKSRGYDCHALTFDYGQRHVREIKNAKVLADKARAKIARVDLPFFWHGSSLLDKKASLPSRRSIEKIKSSGVPTTYVPARNTVFLSIAASYAEATHAEKIFIGAHSEDSSGYPDCRIGYLEAFRRVIKLGTEAGLKGKLDLEFPLIRLSKRGIIEMGAKLGVPFAYTWSCYSGGKEPCGVCDSCILRAKGFKDAGVADPLIRVAA